MAEIFRDLLSMSLSACVVILTVIVLRFVLSGVPRKWSYLLWTVVGFRLCCPVSVRSAASVFSAVPSEIRLFHPVAGNQSVTAMPSLLERTLSAPVRLTEIVTFEPQPVFDWFALCGWIWIAGLAIMLFWGFVRFLRLRSILLDAVLTESNIYETDRIDSPFILGLFRPKIYLPLGLDGERRRYVLAHERFHLRRGDQWCKFFAFILLSVYWFNPLCWLAFYLMNRDMEISCDEHVLSKERASGADYSASLLSFAAPRYVPAPTPLSFGESDVSLRVKNALRWKRPKAWVTILALLLSIGTLAACAMNPARRGDDTAGNPRVFRDAALASFEAGEKITTVYSDGTTEPFGDGDKDASDGFLQALAAVDWQGVSPDGLFTSGMDCIKLQTDSWTLETYSGTDYVRFVPVSGKGGGWLWWEIPEENRETGSIYYNLNWGRQFSASSAAEWRNTDIEVEFDSSSPFSQYQQELAVDAIMESFAQFGEGFQMKRISYDHECTMDEIAWLNQHADAPGAGSFYTGVCFRSDFHTPPQEQMKDHSMNPDTDYTDWSWWLARGAGDDWVVVDMGY